ncbi:MAG: ABC transporter permease, partial [Actinobacteria bacterium]|nr:ABC transporter permease [Actinomycetota bacterium]MCG2796369.1 ABC transporter permease [Actinomycetes bacterium]
ILRRIKVSPISLPTFLGSGIATVLILAFAQAVLLLLVGVVAFGVNIGGNYFYMGVIVLVGALSFLALGFMISSLAGTAKSATLAATAVAMPMMFLAGIFFPIDFIPKWLSVIAQCLPLYYFADALREVMINGASLAAVWLDIVVLVAFGIVCFLVSVKFFRWE